jgi:GNAT superfamily N-acetyltransferase
MSSVKLARSDAEIARCFAVMHELRPHLAEADFVARVREQEKQGYFLAFVEEDGRVVSVAGSRIMENLFSGRVFYIDDLVSVGAERSKGHGKLLFDWLKRYAREKGCDYLELDSGVQRFDAHRFYLTNRMVIAAHHFRLKVE